MKVEGKAKWWGSVSAMLVYLFFATLPFLNYKTFLYFGSSTRSINLIVVSSILAILLGVYLLQKDTRVSFIKSNITLVSLLYLAILFVSALFGGNFHTSFFSTITRTTGLWYLLSLGFFVLVLTDFLRHSEKRKRLLLVIILSSALFSLCSVLGPEGFNILFTSHKFDGFTFGNSTFAAMYMFGAFLLSLYFVSSEEKKSVWKILLPIIIVINPYLTNITGRVGDSGAGISRFLGEARASSVAFFGSILALLLIWAVSKIKNKDVKKKTAYALFGVGLVTVVCATISLLSPEGSLRNMYLSQATKARPLVWEMSAGLIKQKPILGYGLDTFEKVFELNYDSRILQIEYGGETWFDRAHNVFIDQSLESGLLGLLAYCLIYLVVIFSMIKVALDAPDKKSRLLAVFVLVYFTFHLVEVQTAFDTSISYVMLAVMLSLAVLLRTEISPKETQREFSAPGAIKNMFASILAVFFSWSLFWQAIPFIASQMKNGEIRTVGSAAKRIPMYPTLFSSSVDLPAVLWRTFTDFERGISENPAVLADPKKTELLKQELAIFEETYEKYVEKHPNDFRALLNLADAKIYFMLFEVNKLEEAQEVLDRAQQLVPQAPQPYWMKSVAYLYMQKFDLAKQYAKKAHDLNPRVPVSNEIVKYINDSIKTFPDIDLYFFRQI